jgi:soluble lytic murein transglycosylase-like protein
MSIASLLCSSVLAIGMPRAEHACRHMETLVEEAIANDIEPEVLIALIHEESRWKSWVESKAGACGLTQVIPKYAMTKISCSKLKRPKTSIRVGAKVLSHWVYEYGDGDYITGLCGYNGGYNCPTLSRSKAYARRIMRMAKKLTAEATSQRAYRMLMESLKLQFNVNPSTTDTNVEK